MKFEQTSANLIRNKNILHHVGARSFPKKLNSLSDEELDMIKQEIDLYYFTYEWGLKLLARNVFDISYTKCRSLFDFLGIAYRKGMNVSTKGLSEFRKAKAEHENRHGIGFNDLKLNRFSNTTQRGVQGYYFNRSTSSYVWLRSTYEYIYSKFLNKIGVNWKVEQEVYKLSDGTSYRPDFYIYDEQWNLTKIVEIKGFWDNRAYKVDLLKEEFFSKSDIGVVIISDINSYIESHLTYHKELKTWKIIRKSKEQNL